MTPDDAMQRIDKQLSHIWVVRTFLKHSEEAEESEELYGIVRDLYDTCLAVGPAWERKNAAEYLKIIGKKLSKLRAATDELERVLPQVSVHTNFKMALASLRAAVEEIGQMMNA
jgi:hypothetical protein